MKRRRALSHGSSASPSPTPIPKLQRSQTHFPPSSKSLVPSAFPKAYPALSTNKPLPEVCKAKLQEPPPRPPPPRPATSPLCSESSLSPNLLIWGGAVGPGTSITEHFLFILLFFFPIFSEGWEGLRWRSRPPAGPRKASVKSCSLTSIVHPGLSCPPLFPNPRLTWASWPLEPSHHS